MDYTLYLKEINNAFNNYFSRRKNMTLEEKIASTNIVFDADNTLFLFSVFGKEEESLEKMYAQGFYKNLPVFLEAPYVLKALQDMGFKVWLRSAVLNTPFCKEEKMISFQYHFPFIPVDRITFTEVGENKMNNLPFLPEDTIIVDDYKGNLIDAYLSGAIGIKKTYTGKYRPIPQVCNLTDIFPILIKLLEGKNPIL